MHRSSSLRRHNNIFLQIMPIVSCILALVVTTLPIISGNIIGSRCSAEIHITGYNLAEHSGYGLGVLITPLILLNIHYSKLTFQQRILAYLTILTGYVFCYGLSVLASKEWLLSLESIVPVTYRTIKTYGGQWLIPIGTVFEVINLLLSYTLEQMKKVHSKNKVRKAKNGGTYYGNLQTRKTEQVQSHHADGAETASKARRVSNQRRFRYYHVHR